jgi:hypothetical protein
VTRVLGLPLAPVLPLRFCPLPGPLYTVLMGYKESPIDEARQRYGPMVGRLLAALLVRHAPCLIAAAGGPLDLVLPVPSTARPGPSPLSRVEGLSELVDLPAGLQATWHPALLQRTGHPVGHMRPHPHAFEVPEADRRVVAGSRILLVDDTYVSGARSQSAAAALRLAGARAVLISPVGRVLRPDRSASHAAFLARAVQATNANIANNAINVNSHRPVDDEPCGRCVLTQMVDQTVAGTG